MAGITRRGAAVAKAASGSLSAGMKLLLIEMNLLRIEVEQSRSIREEAQAREAFFSASVKQLTEGRDKWRREAERLRDLIEQDPPWSLFWRRLVDSFAASRRSASEWHRA